METRIYFLDNLRTFLIFLVVLLHAGIVYESVLESNWMVIDPVKNNSIGLIRMYLDLFIMYTMFFISGYFIPISLKKKTSWEYIKSKFKRILLPWMVAVLTLIPAYKIIFLYSRGMPQEEWYSYFHFFQRTGSDLSLFSNDPSQSWLWFLPILFIFQLLYLGLAKLNMLSFNISIKNGIILTFVVGLIYSLIISLNGLSGWLISPFIDFQKERILVYFLVFLLGSLCYKLKVFDAKGKNKKLYIAANIMLTLALSVFTVVALNLFFNLVDPGRNYYFISEIIDKSTYYVTALLSMLSFLYIFIHLFRFNFNKNYRIMEQLNKNSYQVYIIHIIVMGVIALVMVYIPIPSFIKYLILTILTFMVSNIIVSGYRKIFGRNNPLKIAALAGSVILLFTIISYGNGKTPEMEKENAAAPRSGISQYTKSLHAAVIEGDMKAIQYHIESGTDLNEREPSGGSSPLISAATFGRTEAAIALIEAGADVNFINNDGSTPLHTAAFFCRPEIVEVLLNKGADKSIKNNAGSTAIETVTVPFELVKGIYEYFGKVLGPLGLVIDIEQIQVIRPQIAKMLEE